MKIVKIMVALLLTAVMTVSLTGCFGTANNNSDTPATEAPDISTYPKDFIGLQQYLIDQALVPYADLTGLRKAADAATPGEATPSDASKAAEAATQAATEATSAARTELYYDLIGADDGIRYTVSGNIFVELYDFSKSKNADSKAKATLADIKDDGKFTPIEGLDELTGVISKSGSYVVLYNAKNGYDGYEKIAKALESW